MIFQHEAEQIVPKLASGEALNSQDVNALEFCKLGGCHANVSAADRSALRAWLNSGAPLPNQNAKPAHPQRIEQQQELPL